MKYRDLRDFLAALKARGQLLEVKEPVSTDLEMTWLSDRTLRAGGPALLFTHPVRGTQKFTTPAVTNLFGTPERVAFGMGADSVAALRDIGELLARLKEPEPPKGLQDAGQLWQMARTLWDMKPAVVRRPACQEQVIEGLEVDLGRLPVQHCWPGDVAPLITWGLVVTRGPQSVPRPRRRQNLGIYRQQVIGRRQVIMRWLAHRGGSGHDPGRGDPGT